jgi:7-cyano-7-deazaguanine synthase
LRPRCDAPALILLSGGLDSAVVSVIAAEENARLFFLTYDYGQLNRKELECARRVAAHFRPAASAHWLVQLDFNLLKAGKGSRLLAGTGTEESRASFFVPGRNLVFLAHAAALAEAHSIPRIYVGVTLQDSMRPGGGYRDASRTFLRHATNTINAGLPKRQRVEISAPMVQTNRWEGIRFAHGCAFDFGKTWTCYRNGSAACGRCPACFGRVLNFHWAGLVDPLSYEQPQTEVLAQALAHAG